MLPRPLLSLVLLLVLLLAYASGGVVADGAPSTATEPTTPVSASSAAEPTPPSTTEPAPLSTTEPAPPGAVWLLNLEGALGPATADYLARGIAAAADAGAGLIVIRMDTPGGLDRAMRDVIESILASPVPVASFVSPQGARAASAGTYILYASHVAAMAPATTLGAATPVAIGMPTSPKPPSPMPAIDEPLGGGAGDGADDGADKGADNGTNNAANSSTNNGANNSANKGSQPRTAEERKMVNDAAAYIRGLAKLRGRNSEWAERAVREAASLSAQEALDADVIDLVAADIDALLGALDGRDINMGDTHLTLQLQGAALHEAAPDWRTQLLAAITNPNLVLILGMLGFYGILLEFYNPGSLVPGTVGVISLLLAGYALQLLPVNYAGLALLVVGLGLMVAEALSPSFGVLGAGGLVAFVMGGIILFDSELDAFRVAWPLLAAVGMLTAGLVVVTVNLAMRVRHRAVTTGVEQMVGRTGVALDSFSGTGPVRVGGEIWTAHCDQALQKDDPVTVTAVNQLTLKVTKGDS